VVAADFPRRLRDHQEAWRHRPKVLRKHGAIPLHGAVLTSASNLPFKGIIHVTGINMLWRAVERSIRDSQRNARAVAKENGVESITFLLIGAGSGGFDK
jgi:O-acetyl-ADP-ribose deacetylase (regulator of RNase III)